MTVSTEKRRFVYNTDGVTKSWPIEFQYINGSEVKVFLIDPGGVETPITDTHVAGAVVRAPADASAFATGQHVRIERVLPYTQLSDYTQQGKFSPQDMERTADSMTMLAQQVRDTVLDIEDYVDENVRDVEVWKEETIRARDEAQAAKDEAALRAGESRSYAMQSGESEESARRFADDAKQYKRQTETLKGETQDIADGIINYAYTGEWSPSAVYSRHNTVSYFGSSYVSKQDGNTGNQPGINGWWGLLALKGADVATSEVDGGDAFTEFAAEIDGGGADN